MRKDEVRQGLVVSLFNPPITPNPKHSTNHEKYKHGVIVGQPFPVGQGRATIWRVHVDWGHFVTPHSVNLLQLKEQEEV